MSVNFYDGLRHHNLAVSKTGIPYCGCGCKTVTHIHASLAHRVAPTGVLHHQMPEGQDDRYFKVDALGSTRPHDEGHDMTDLELLYTFACYDENPASTSGLRLPLPRTVKWENFMSDEMIKEGRAALHKHERPSDWVDVRLVAFPHQSTRHDGAGAVCRFGDRVLLAKRIGKELKLFEVDVVGTAPSVGIFVATSRKDLPELDIKEDEPMFATEVNIVEQRRGDHWMTDAAMDAAREEFEQIEAKVLRGEPVYVYNFMNRYQRYY